MAENRRSSGLSETSSEVDSAAESPDLNEVTSESLVSNKVNMLSMYVFSFFFIIIQAWSAVLLIDAFSFTFSMAYTDGICCYH